MIVRIWKRNSRDGQYSFVGIVVLTGDNAEMTTEEIVNGHPMEQDYEYLFYIYKPGVGVAFAVGTVGDENG